MGLYEDATKRVGTGLYLKLDAGEKRIRILDHPYVSNKAGFKPEDPIRTVFSWLVWNYDEKRVQVLEQGPGLFKMVAAVAKQWGEEMPMRCDLVITTTGSGIETKRTTVAIPHAGTMPPTASLKSQNDGKDWPDLERLTNGVPLERFAKGEDPKDAAELALPTYSDVEASAQKDVVLTDLDTSGPVNLDDIPF